MTIGGVSDVPVRSRRIINKRWADGAPHVEIVECHQERDMAESLDEIHPGETLLEELMKLRRVAALHGDPDHKITTFRRNIAPRDGVRPKQRRNFRMTRPGGDREMKKHIVILGSLLLTPILASAEHSWGPYHWARTANPFALKIVNSTTPDWDPYVAQATGDWSVSDTVAMIETQGNEESKVRRQCNAPSGQVRICNLAYGQNGWLGIAGISIDTSGHIIKGYTKLNDTYFSWAYYNTPDWKQSVTCQELGHNIGLDHQDEDFSNGSLLSCMDYQDPPYPSPNAHDYEQLDQIYGSHVDAYDSYDTGGGGTDGGGCTAPQGKGCNKGEINGELKGHNGDIGWGISLGRRGQQETFLRIDPDGTRHLTHVTWAIGY